MTKHTCNKEVEISQIHNDVTWIRRKLEGNGEEGLVRKVTKNTQHRIEAQERQRLLTWAVGSGWGITLIGFIFMISHFFKSL